MLMPMMNIRKMRVFVRHNDVFVPMGVRGGSIACKGDVVPMLMMGVVRVTVLMGLGCVGMLMNVIFGQVQPYTNRH